MKSISRTAGAGLIAAFAFTPFHPVLASDHADPLVLNMLRPPEQREPRITDLHVFLDSDQNGSGKPPEALVVSVCVFPAMPPLLMAQTAEEAANGLELPLPSVSGVPTGSTIYRRPDLKLDEFRYTINLDLHSPLRFDDASDVSRYGGTVVTPSAIAADVTLKFRLNNDATIKEIQISGFDPGEIVKSGAFRPDRVNVRTGIFDDPFIFPRFFRRNVVGTVFSIPLGRLPAGWNQMLIWATSHKGTTQRDHVGRSQRTQLPRFDGLNSLSPNRHVDEINRRHNKPTVAEDFMRTFLSPLFGRRPFDAAPDVMFFRRSAATGFPNGRKLTDDVTYLTALQGDTQLLEASFTESPQYRRAGPPDKPLQGTVNDKAFSTTFPYLASPWTQEQVRADPPGFALGRPALQESTWHALGFSALGALVVGVLLLCLALGGWLARLAAIAAALLAAVLLLPVFASNLPSSDSSPAAVNQQSRKLHRLLLVSAAAGGFFLVGIYVLGRRHGAKTIEPEGIPEGNQDLTMEDRQYAGLPYNEVRDAVMAKPYYGVWGAPESPPLPVYPVRLSRLLSGFLTLRRPFHFGRAQRRTLRSKSDLRWGPDKMGFRRLLHPNGICLTGDWIIEGGPENPGYTGCFQRGTRTKIIGRYSTCCTETRGGHWRSMSIVCKIYPQGSSDYETVTPANFFTQEDLGGTLSSSIRDVALTNSPPVSPWRRGKGLFTFLLTGFTFAKADKMNTERQLYEVAELGKPDGIDTVCPRYIRLTVAPSTFDPGGRNRDYRDEILDTMYDRGNPVPQRHLVFDIEVSDEGERSGRLIQRLKGQKWARIGRIVFKEAAASYNGDFVIHFHHAPWRDDRNKPGTEFLADLRGGQPASPGAQEAPSPR